MNALLFWNVVALSTCPGNRSDEKYIQLFIFLYVLLFFLSFLFIMNVTIIMNDKKYKRINKC